MFGLRSLTFFKMGSIINFGCRYVFWSLPSNSNRNVKIHRYTQQTIVCYHTNDSRRRYCSNIAIIQRLFSLIQYSLSPSDQPVRFWLVSVCTWHVHCWWKEVITSCKMFLNLSLSIYHLDFRLRTFDCHVQDSQHPGGCTEFVVAVPDNRLYSWGTTSPL